MTEQVGVLAGSTFTYAALDDLADQTAEIILALWILRPELDLETWIGLVVDALVGLVLQAEGYGRLYGEHDARTPIADLAFVPDVVAIHRPVSDDFQQSSTIAPDVAPLDVAAREREIAPRIERALRTIVATGVDDLQRVERLARDEPIAAAQRGYQDGLRENDSITGYRRKINPDACELCFWLWKEGYVYPIDQPMHRHIGCRCVPVPTNDRLGRHAFTPEDQQLFDDLYDLYAKRKAAPS